MRCSKSLVTQFQLAAVCLIICSTASAQESQQWYPGSSNGLRDPNPVIEQTSSNTTTNSAGARYGSTPALKPLASQPDITPIPSPKTKSLPKPKSVAPAQRRNESSLSKRYGAPQERQPVNPKANEFQTRMTALEMAVSTVVAEEPNLWRFEPLELEATQLLILASNESEREMVRQLAKRLENFSNLADRYRNIRTQVASNDGRTTRPAAESSNKQVAKTDATAGSEYDAVGVLRPVVSQRPGAPKFALVDKQGQITSFVTPKPGVDLQPLLGKRLGVRGSRGYIPEYKREHVTAERVAMISGGTTIR